MDENLFRLKDVKDVFGDFRDQVEQWKGDQREFGFYDGYMEGFHMGVMNGLFKGQISAAREMFRQKYPISQIKSISRLPLDVLKDVETEVQEMEELRKWVAQNRDQAGNDDVDAVQHEKDGSNKSDLTEKGYYDEWDED